MNVKINNIVLMVLPRMIQTEIKLQQELLQNELSENDTRYTIFRNELIIELRNLYQDLVSESEEN